MSESLKNIKNYKTGVLKDLINSCTEKQKNLFKRMYPEGIDNLSDEKFGCAIQQCERTIKKNNEKIK